MPWKRRNRHIEAIAELGSAFVIVLFFLAAIAVFVL